MSLNAGKSSTISPAPGPGVNADVTAELIKNIFYPKAPLHDGAMIVVDSRIHAAGCVLPLSASQRLSRELGTRHRAAVGMSETADCVCVVVSEETGSISVAVGGMLKRHLAPEMLQRVLEAELMPAREEGDRQKEQALFEKGREISETVVENQGMVGQTRTC